MQIYHSVYADVPDAFKRWHNAGIRVAIYSSGSIKAQKLLFGQTDFGDLLPYIMGHFDTTSGHKQETQSYINISNALACDSSDILFLTDIIKGNEKNFLLLYICCLLIKLQRQRLLGRLAIKRLYCQGPAMLH